MTATLTLLEVRCSTCWNSNCFPVETVGQAQACRHCQKELTVPEATPERIARAEALIASQPELLEPAAPVAPQVDPQLSDQQVIQLMRKESAGSDQMDFVGYPTASLVARFLAMMIDQFLYFVSLVMGIVLLVAMAKMRLTDNPIETYRLTHHFSLSSMILTFNFTAMLVASQWVLLSTSGQTIGKKLMMIRVVTIDGKLPGFLQAVVLRNWVRNLLYMIPFAWLVDCLFALSDSKRAGHDWIAGTHVVANI